MGEKKEEDKDDAAVLPHGWKKLPSFPTSGEAADLPFRNLLRSISFSLHMLEPGAFSI